MGDHCASASVIDLQEFGSGVILSAISVANLATGSGAVALQIAGTYFKG
jgi:hypothetical protein